MTAFTLGNAIHWRNPENWFPPFAMGDRDRNDTAPGLAEGDAPIAGSHAAVRY